MLGTKVLEERESKFNGHLRVVKTWGMGTYIQAEGLTQSGGIVEGIWKQTLRKIQRAHPAVGSCLILGLGGGTAARLVRTYWPDVKITGIEIDPIMIELGMKYLGLGEANADIKIQDAGKPVSGKFDLVIVDLYQGDKFPEKFGDGLSLKRLTKNKLVVFNRLYYGSRHSYKEKKKEAEEFGKKLKKVFKRVECYYPEANIMFFAGRG